MMVFCVYDFIVQVFAIMFCVCVVVDVGYVFVGLCVCLFVFLCVLLSLCFVSALVCGSLCLLQCVANNCVIVRCLFVPFLLCVLIIFHVRCLSFSVFYTHCLVYCTGSLFVCGWCNVFVVFVS